MRTHKLSARALKQLAATPVVGGSRNRLRAAFALANARAQRQGARCRQKDIAEATGINESNLSRLMNSRRFDTVTMGTAQRLATFFGVPVDVLFPAPSAPKER